MTHPDDTRGPEPARIPGRSAGNDKPEATNPAVAAEVAASLGICMLEGVLACGSAEQ